MIKELIKQLSQEEILNPNKLMEVFVDYSNIAMYRIKPIICTERYIKFSTMQVIYVTNKKYIKRVKTEFKKVIKENGWENIIEVKTINDLFTNSISFGLKQNLTKNKLETFINLLKLQNLC